MATSIIDTDAGGGHDYTSLSAWEADLPATLTEVESADCRCTSGGADTTAVTFSGVTTSASYYINVYAGSGYRHAGVWSTSKYRIDTGTNVTQCTISDDYVRIDGIQFKLLGGSSNVRGIYMASANYTRLSNFIIYGDTEGASNTVTGIYAYTGGNHNIYNGIIYGFSPSGQYGWGIYNRVVSNYCNLTIYDCNVGYENNGSNGELWNCAVFETGDDFVHSSTYIHYCASDDGDGDNAVTPSDWSTVFEDISNRNFHLKSTDTDLIGAGTTDPLSGLFSDDIDGDTRSSPWDIGADEYVSAGTTKSVSDSVGVADAIGSLSALVSVADSISPADGLGGGIGAAVPISDSISIADSQTIAALVQIAEAITAADAVAGVAVQVAISDVVGISEALSIQVAFTVADAVGVVDAPTISVELSIADAVAITDSVWSGIAVRIAEAIGVADAVAALSVELTVGESITVSDAPTIYVSLSVPDSITATDSVDVEAFLAIADALGVSDDVSIQIVGTLKAVADAVGVSDEISVPAVRVVISDVATVTDAVVQVSALLSVLETIGVSDAVVSFDSATKIVEVTFSFKKRSTGFSAAKPAMEFTATKRSTDFEFN